MRKDRVKILTETNFRRSYNTFMQLLTTLTENFSTLIL